MDAWSPFPMPSPPLLANFLQAMRLVRRELRSGLKGFGVFLACLTLGVFAISAIGSFVASAENGLLSDASALLGGDIETSFYHRELSDSQRAYFVARGKISHVMTMRSMATDPAGENRLLVELKAVDSTYPLYGQIGIEPEQSLEVAIENRNGFGALVEQSLLDRLQLKVGDRLRLGDGHFTIRVVITAEPDRTIQAFTLGPRLMINQKGLESTGLIQPGSLIRHAYRLRLVDREQVDSFKEELQKRFPEAGWQLRTWREAAPRVRFFLDRMNLNLTLLGLCALLVGGLGVSGAVRGYLDSKVTHIATMKCLGASGQLVMTAYLLQIMLLGAAAAVGGLSAGAATPFLIKQLAGSLLPIPIVPEIYPQVLLKAALFGLLIALIFSLKPLGSAGHLSPALLFRGYGGFSGQKPGLNIWIAISLATVALGSLAVFTSSDRRLALWFIAGALGTFVIFRLATQILIRLSSRLPRPSHPSLRLGLGNLHRRGSAAGNALFSLGLGLTTLVVVVSVQANLNDMVMETVPKEAPSFFFLDLQTHQVEQFEQVARSQPGVSKVERYPTLRGRIVAIAGVPVEQAEIAADVKWAVRGDRFLSYAGEMPPETEVVAGSWWPADYSGPAKVSITADIAKGFGVSIGDSLTINILGREVKAEIASLRRVDWSTLDLNFAILFAPGTLENAPQTHIASLHLPAEYEEQAFRTITDMFPSLSTISTREVLQNVTRTLERIGTAFQGMAAIALVSGFLVLAGAVSADQHRRIHDAVIFKVCGATRGNIIASFAAEFLLIGLAAGVISVLVGSLAAYGITEGLLKIDYQMHPALIGLTLLTGIALTLLLGLLGTWKALGQKPAIYLRID